MSQRHALLFFAFAFLVNVLGASTVTTEGDALGEVRRAIEPSAARPNHLLQTPLFRVASSIAARSGFDGAPFVPLQFLNAILGALAAALFFPLLRLAGIRPSTATVIVAVWILSWAPWFHSRTAETGITPMPFALGTFVLLLRGSPHDASGPIRGALSGALLAFACMLSLAIALLAPAWLYLLARRYGRHASLAGAAVAGVAVAIPFLVTADREGVPLAEIPAWVVHHPDASGLAPGGKIGVARALTGVGRLVFPVSPGETAIKARLVGAEVDVEGGDYLTLARNLAATLLLLGAAGLGAWKIVRPTHRPALRAPGEPGEPEPLGRIAVLAITAIAPTAIFCMYWLGSDPQFWLPVYPFLLMLAGFAHDLLRPRLEPATLLLSAALVVTLYLTNVVMGPPTTLHPSGDDRWRGASEIGSRMPHAALVLRPGVGRSPLEFLRFFRPDVEVESLAYDAPGELRGEDLLRWIEREVDAMHVAGRSVYFEGLTGELPASLLGSWGYVANARGLTREEIREHLRRTRGLDAVPGISQRLVRIRTGVSPGEA